MDGQGTHSSLMSLNVMPKKFIELFFRYLIFDIVIVIQKPRYVMIYPKMRFMSYPR